MNCVRSGNVKSWNDDCHWLVNWLNVRDLVVRAAATFTAPGTCDCNTRPHWALQISSARIAWRDHSRANWLQSVMRSDAHCACEFRKIKIVIHGNSFRMRSQHLPLHLYKCNWYRVLGMPNGQYQLVDHRFGSLERHSLAMRWSQLSASNGMVHVDSCKYPNWIMTTMAIETEEQVTKHLQEIAW